MIKLRKNYLMRSMRAYNPVPQALQSGCWHLEICCVEKKCLMIPQCLADSRNSYLVQMADLAAYSLFRRDHPRANLAPYKFETFFDILTPVLVKGVPVKPTLKE